MWSVLSVDLFFSFYWKPHHNNIFSKTADMEKISTKYIMSQWVENLGTVPYITRAMWTGYTLDLKWNHVKGTAQLGLHKTATTAITTHSRVLADWMEAIDIFHNGSLNSLLSAGKQVAFNKYDHADRQYTVSLVQRIISEMVHFSWAII